MNKSINLLVPKAVNGDSAALEEIIREIKDPIYNLSLRMLGLTADAEDASQDILIKVITNLSAFRQKAAFQTWVYRIAVRYLIDYKKSMFAQHPLDFEFYANDIRAGYLPNDDELLLGADRQTLAKELKMSCTNVMLQCLDAQSRCIYILGTMFHFDSRIAADMLDLSPENYRQKLSRARHKMADFLQANCGLAGGTCDCFKRVGFAIKTHRLDPGRLAFSHLKTLNHSLLEEYTEAMEVFDEQMDVFENLPHYQSPVDTKKFIQKLVSSDAMIKIRTYEETV